MSIDDKAVGLGFLICVLGIVLCTTPWWRAGVALLPMGLFLGGAEKIFEFLRSGYAEAMGWTDRGDDV